MDKNKKVVIINNIAPLYIEPFWRTCNNENLLLITFITGRGEYNGIKTIEPNDFIKYNKRVKWEFVNNIYIRRILIYQFGLVKISIFGNFDVFVFSGDMYNFSTWISSIICKIRKKKTIFWGHGFYGNENFIKKIIRKSFYKIPDLHFLYGTRAKDIMQDMGFDKEKLFTVYNSLDYNLHSKLFNNKNIIKHQKIKSSIFPKREHLPTVIFIGRLTKEKKLHLLIESINIQKIRGNDFNLIIVGEGSEKKTLLNLITIYNLTKSIKLLGESYDENYNASLIMLSDCCVSPGNVGLTAIHSLSLGVPVITQDNLFNQGPEVESVIENETGFFFKENDPICLSNAIENFVNLNKKNEMSPSCIKIIKEKYNPNNQYKIISTAILNSL